MKVIIPLVLAAAGTLAGAGIGLVLAPEPELETEEVGEGKTETGPDEDEAGLEYVALGNQFVVPIVRDGRVSALVVLAISLEVEAGTGADVFAREPRVRDSLLAVLFEHANAGGFDGTFTQSRAMRTLRTALREAARSTVGDMVRDALITEIVRQEY
ncbi:MAG: flagellar basal body-associated FliL family protein [Pseudomonadota bacterium]